MFKFIAVILALPLTIYSMEPSYTHTFQKYLEEKNFLPTFVEMFTKELEYESKLAPPSFFASASESLFKDRMCHIHSLVYFLNIMSSRLEVGIRTTTASALNESLGISAKIESNYQPFIDRIKCADKKTDDFFKRIVDKFQKKDTDLNIEDIIHAWSIQKACQKILQDPRNLMRTIHNLHCFYLNTMYKKLNVPEKSIKESAISYELQAQKINLKIPIMRYFDSGIFFTEMVRKNQIPIEIVLMELKLEKDKVYLKNLNQLRSAKADSVVNACKADSKRKRFKTLKF